MIARTGRLGVAALLAAAVSRASAQTPPVFRASVESVYVDVFARRGGQAISGLQASSFELKDNGVPQAVELVTADSRPLRAVLVFDTSSSVVGRRLFALKAAGEAFLNGLRPADEVALVGFSDEIAWLARSSTDKDVVRRALDRLEPEGATAAFDALYAAVALMEEGGRCLIVLFTDGEDNMSFLDDKQLVTVVERSNALVHTVVWSEPGEEMEPDQLNALRRIAAAGGGRFWGAGSPERLRLAFAEIAEAMSHRYILRYEPRGVEREGWHRIEVKLKGPKGDVEARPGYWASPRVR